MYLVRNVLHSHNTLTQHIRENLPSVTRPFLSSCMDLGTRLGIYCVCLSSILGIRLHAHTDGHLCCTARILGTCTHIHTQPYPPLLHNKDALLPHSEHPGNDTQTCPPVLHSKDTPTSNRTERIPGMRLHTHTRDGLIRYQIFDAVDTGLHSDVIDMCKHYQRVSIHVCATLHMH